ncbi:MAG: tetratricopeptide repeat protein [Thermoanaerobaculia bacterium]
MPPNRDQLLQSAEKAAAKGRLDSALKDYLRVLDDNPKDISTLNKVGDLYVRMNRPADSVPFFIRIADFYARDGFFLKAIAIYKKINKIDPAKLEVYDRLADLYHKQGLTQDARSQYQVLADHYLKSNKPDEAIAAYKKMTTVDPNDLKIQVRLADLYRNNKQIDQAVMQYGLIGSMLLRRGAHDEAAAVFQRALELSPNDAGIQKNLVRSLLAQKNPTAAIAIVKAAPRTADTMALLAEAQLEMGQKGDAAHSVEQAIALDARHEGARVLLCQFRLAEESYDQALAAVASLVDAAVASKDAARAAGLLAPILQANPAHRETLQKMAAVREAEGNAPEAARLRLSLAREDESRGETASAVKNYQLVLRSVPGQPDAIARLHELAPSVPLPSGATAVPRLSQAAGPGPAAGAPVQGVGDASAPAASAADQEIETLVVEAEVFAKYGLTDKAVERLRTLVRRRPDLVRARQRLVELMVESQNPAMKQEAEALAESFRREGRVQEAEELLARVAKAAIPAAPRQPAAPVRPAAAEVTFDEFEIEPSPAAPAEPEPITDLVDELTSLADPEVPIVEAQPPAPPLTASAGTHRETPATPHASMDSEFVAYEELDSLLEEEMQKAGEAPLAAPRQPAAPVVEEQNLFADEQQFFNLAEELEKELAEEAPPPVAPVMAGPEGEASLEEIFREFKKGVEQQLSAEDYETHFNLGIAYKEMGLIDESIGEFQLASKDANRTVECCSMLGLCFLEKGMPQLAIKWYRKGLETPGIPETASIGLLYDLGCVYQSAGETELAYRTFLEVYGFNTNYRDVVHRVKELEGVKKDS